MDAKGPGTDCDWMALQLGALFHHDSRGRISDRRAPGRPRAPRFFLGRTRHGNVWRLREDLSKRLVRSLSRLAGKELALGRGDPPQPPERIESMRRLLAEVAPISLEWRGPAFRFPADESAQRRLAHWAVGVLRVEPEDSAVREGVSDAFGDLAGELAQRTPCFAVYEGERLISIAYSAAGAGGPATEVGVDTVSDQRGRGHAGRCVSAWALAQIEAGAHPLYSTSWANSASLAVARKLGLTLYGEDLHWT